MTQIEKPKVTITGEIGYPIILEIPNKVVLPLKWHQLPKFFENLEKKSKRVSEKNKYQKCASIIKKVIENNGNLTEIKSDEKFECLALFKNAEDAAGFLKSVKGECLITGIAFKCRSKINFLNAFNAKIINVNIINDNVVSYWALFPSSRDARKFIETIGC